MATLMNKPKADLTPEELEEREKHEFQDSDRNFGYKIYHT